MMRDQGLVGVRVLDELATATTGTPDQTDRFPSIQRAQRIDLALDVPSGGLQLVIMAVVGLVLCVTALKAMLEAAGIGTTELHFSVALFVALLVYALSRRHRLVALRNARLAEVTAWPARQPFPVTGFASWLIAEVPLLDVYLSGPTDKAKLEGAFQAIDAAITLQRIDERTMRVTIPPRRKIQQRGSDLLFGNVPLLDRVFRELLIPLHGDGAIDHVTMGGLVLAK
jgi:hypothetical protein